MSVQQWERISHEVAIAGQITDAQTGKAVPGARVTISLAPSAFTDWLAIRRKQYGERWDKMAERPDRTVTSADGHFHFLDLPDGQYTLQCTLPAAAKRYGSVQAQVSVTRNAEGKINKATADMSLPPTSIKGQIRGPDAEDTMSDVVMGQVRVKGSGEKAFSDSQGRYLLTQIETGKRELVVTASGYQQQTQIVQLNTAGQEVVADFTLVRTT